MSQSLRITAPSRLHFGLLRFACTEGRSYGGLGMMIDRPGLVVELAPADRWHADGPGGERALQLARQAQAALVEVEAQPLKIHVLRSPRLHSGLGSGTQLALAIAEGVDRLLGNGRASLKELVAAVGRGQRGAVGSYGFRRGGMIWEQGKYPGKSLGNLCRRVEVPKAWRVVLITLVDAEGLSGEVERKAFENLPPVRQVVTDELTRLAEQEIIPAAEQGDLDTFSTATYQYGVLAGNCFAPIQGGPFASPHIAELVRLTRELGVEGVGQSSWGPTVFAFVQDKAAADALVGELQRLDSIGNVRLDIARPDNRGARIEPAATCSEKSVAHKSLAK